MPTLKDARKRSIVKSIIWRIVSFFVLATVSWLITHNWKTTTLITLIFHGILIVLYYIHERAWERISWGKSKHPLSKLSVKDNLRPEDIEKIRSKLKELGYIEK